MSNSDWGCLPSLGYNPLKPDTHRGGASSAYHFLQSWIRSRNCNKPVYNHSFLHQEEEPWQTVRKRRRAPAPSYGRKTWGSNGYTFQADQVLRDSWSPGFGNPVHSGEQDHFYNFAEISRPWGVSQMGQYHPMAEEKFWGQPMKLWKGNCLGPIAVSQGEGSRHIECLSHPRRDANQECEWGACGVTRPKPAANLVTHNRFELLAEETPALYQLRRARWRLKDRAPVRLCCKAALALTDPKSKASRDVSMQKENPVIRQLIKRCIPSCTTGRSFNSSWVSFP